MQWWNWQDPGFSLAFLAVVIATLGVIATIGVAVAVEKSRRDADKIAERERTERVLRERRQRRDELLQKIPLLTSPLGVRRVWREVFDWPDQSDQRWLLAEFRANPQTPLPSSARRSPTGDSIDNESVDDYIASLSTRYSSRENRWKSFDGLSAFISSIEGNGVKISLTNGSLLASLVSTDPAADVQRPSHQFYREFVGEFPWIAGTLLHTVERIPHDAVGSRRVNVLTGVLLAAVDLIEERDPASRTMRKYGVEKLKDDYLSGLASLLHRRVITGIGYWDLDGRTEPVSATIAWLIRVVGWSISGDSHITMRAVENLERAVLAIPEEDRGWGVDIDDVRKGLADIERKAPLQWSVDGSAITSAVESVSNDR